VTVQYRPAGGRWHSTTIRPVISSTGRYSVKLSFTTAGKVWLRFTYTGSLTGAWLSAVSPGRLFVVK
jgi:hypothetical protein